MLQRIVLSFEYLYLAFESVKLNLLWQLKVSTLMANVFENL